MKIRVLFFGMLKDVTGLSSDQVDFAGPLTSGLVWQHYADRFPKLAALQAHVRPAVNHEFSTWDATVSADDELAFLPPVSGGSALPGEVALVRHAIDVRALAAGVLSPAHGAVVTFEGVVRDNTKGRPTEFLEYECYEPMALRMMQALAADIRSNYAIGEIALVHRLGKLAIGEASVVICVSAPHRKPAFDACFEAINRLKSTVPIWKKEHFEGGEVWVEGEWPVHV
jgi:molybdopterin synthase catalytic subunit/molybdopterin converting factor small subunit